MKKKIIFFILVLFVVVPYQNCSPVSFLSINSSVLDLKSDNNGTGYGGKPDYYRFVPDFTCEAKVSPVSSLHITDTQATLVENKKIACVAVTTNLDPHLIDTSIYQSEIVGYQEGIYEGESTAPEAIPANLVEVWCRDQKDESGIETITHFNRTTQEAVTRIYYSKPVTNKNQTINQHQEISDFSVARILSFNRVTIQDKQNFDLKVFRDQPAVELGLFKGEMSALIEGQVIHRETSCRLGGSVDPKVWPVSQIVDLNVSLGKLKLAPDLSSFSYVSASLSPALPNVFSSDFAGQNQRQVGPRFQFSGVEDFNYSPDSKSLFYWGNPVLGGGYDLLKSNIATGEYVRLKDIPSPGDGRGYPLADLAGDGQTIFYEERNAAPFDYAWTLKSIPLTGGRPVAIGPAFVPESVMTGTFDFDISKTANRVAFLAGKLSRPELYISDFDGKNLIKPNVVLPDDTWFIPVPSGTTRPPDGYGNLTVPEPGNFIVLRAYKKRPNLNEYDRYDYLVSIDGAQITRLPFNWSWSNTNSTGQKHLVADENKNVRLYDLASGSSYELPQMLEVYFVRDSLFATRILDNGQFDAVLISTDNGQVSSLCPEAKSTAVKILSAQDRLFVTSYDSAKQILNVFEKSTAASCTKRNSIPLSGSKISEVSLSPDGQKLLVKFSILNQNKNHDQLIYVPLDGQPSIQINTPVYFGAWIWGAYFSKDSASVVYYGDQLKPGENVVFLWHIPKVQP